MPASASSLSALLPASAVGREPLSAVESVGLVQALRVIPDPRRRRRGRRPRPAVGAAARAAGGDGRRVFLDRDRAVVQDGPAGAGHLRGVPVGGNVPTGAGRGHIAAVEAALTTWVTGRQAHAQAQRPVGTAAECRTVLAVDGKTLRGSVGSDGQPTKRCASTTTPTGWSSPSMRW